MNFNKSVFAGAILFALITTGAFAQVKKKPAATTSAKSTAATKGKTAAAAPAKSGALPVDPDVTIGKLANGLTYYIRNNSNPKGQAFILLVEKAGSVLEGDNQQGLAHLVQRTIFDGTKDFNKADIQKFLKGKNPKFNPDVNGNTSFDETVFQMVIPTDTAAAVDKGFKLMANIATGASFNAADFDAEKATLITDINSPKNPQDKLQQQTSPVLLANSKYAQHLPYGKEDAVKNLTLNDAKNFYHEWYRPDLQGLIVVGDIDPATAKKMIETYFASLKNPVPAKPRPVFTVPVVPGTVIKTATDKAVTYTAIQMVTRHPQFVIRNQADMMEDLRETLFNQMMNTRISETVQMQSSPFSFAQVNYGGFTGKLTAFSAVAEAKPGELEAAVKGISAETARAKKFGFTITELERAKQASLAQMSNLYDNRKQAASGTFIAQYLQNFENGSAIPGVEYSYNFYLNNIGKVTQADMLALTNRVMSDQNRSIIIAAPDADKDKLPNEKTVLDWIAAGEKAAAAYNDDVNTEPLMAKLPTPGKIVSRVDDSIVNITRLTLSNGMRVILKPTKFQPNQILINGYALGGTSLASDADYYSASLSAGVIGASGIDNLEQGQLNVKLRNAQFNVTPFVSETSVGISGNTTNADFETAMQLVYLYFTKPRKDVQVWNAKLGQTKSLLSNRDLDPASIFQDTLTALLNNHVRRAMPATVDQINAASLDKAFDFYKARFANASNFTFVLTGSFQTEQMIPFVETYLASIPSTGAKETFKNNGLHPVAGQVSRTITKGKGDKANVDLIYTGKYIYNEDNNIQLDALEEILNRKLIARLPDKTSGAYSISAGVSYLKIPEARYKIIISFAAAPADVDKITSAITDEIAKLRTNGADTSVIKIFVALQARSIQTQLRQNYFWAGYLASSDQEGEDPDRIIPRIQKLSDVTPQSTKQAANMYLNGENLIKLVLVPEGK